MTSDGSTSRVAAVVIGRNEGARLVACLHSLRSIDQLIYVDSGSSDESVARARDLGVEVVELDMAQPFTAARARNAGLAALDKNPPEFVQFIDGDCTLRSGWVNAGLAFLEVAPAVAVVCGRRRERFPEASIYNWLCDQEWATPVGETRACGGDALMRYRPLHEAGGFRDDLIAGEEPELCVRLRGQGWKIWRLDAEMTWHDANITRISQWFRRAKRAGHAFAEGAALHGAPPERHWLAETRRALLWGAGLPAAALVGAALHPAAWLLWLAYPAQIVRLALRYRATPNGWLLAGFQTFAKFPEALGALSYYARRLRRGKAQLIEYK